MKRILLTLALCAGIVSANGQNNLGVRVNTNSALLFPTAANLVASNWAAIGSAIVVKINPATNTYAGISAALGGFGPATNTYAGIAAALGNFFPATNTYAGIKAALGNFAPATNTYAGIAAALGNFFPATNTYAGICAALGNFFPATNNYLGISNALTFPPATNTYIGISDALTFPPATNTSAGIVAALGHDITQLGGTNLWTGTNKFSNANNEFTAITYTNNGLGNLGLGLVWIATNMATGVLPTTTAPNGSILTSTNGSFYVRSNNAWSFR